MTVRFMQQRDIRRQPFFQHLIPSLIKFDAGNAAGAIGPIQRRRACPKFENVLPREVKAVQIFDQRIR